jgi:ribonuclease P protein subunit RPR2
MSKAVISKKRQKEIARERIGILFQKADDIFSTNKSLANRYVTLARKISMKVQLQMPREFKRKYCKHCYTYLRSGVNARIRTRDGKVVISCFECKKFTRILIK